MFQKRLLFHGATLLVATILTLGCSNNFVQSVNPYVYGSSASAEYFPLLEGYHTTYQITNSNGSSEIISYTVGREVPFLADSATEWISDDNVSKKTNYFVMDGNTLKYYENDKSTPEVVLEFPLTLGKTWSRFDNPASHINDTGTTVVNPLLKDSSNVGVSFVSFLSEGVSLMTVDKIESIELSNGVFYSDAIRVSNDAGGSSHNYFWYAPGVGLVKYVLGAVDSQNPVGAVGSELISYGFKP